MSLPPTPSQTVGPFYGYALPVTGGGEVAPAGHPDTVTVHGHVYDGAGQPVHDALLEFWQADPAGHPPTTPGSLRRDPVLALGMPGASPGRDGSGFTGFGRVPTDGDGHFTLRTLPPGPAGGAAAPFISVCLFARGLLRHLFTRLYLPQHADAHPTDPLLAALEPHRRSTLIAVEERDRVYRFDVRLQGGPAGQPEETVFLDFR